jgi:hypothetical protein
VPRKPEAYWPETLDRGARPPARSAGSFAVGELLQRADDENDGDVVIHLYFVPSSAEYAG